ncbi:hypothetical protein Tco_1450875, partial [Tanacetum coccineum]
MSFSKRAGKNTPQCYTKPLDSLKNWNNRFFWVDERVFPTAVAWRTSAPKDSMPLDGTYSVEDEAILNARRTPIQKQLETLLCLVRLSRRYFLGDDVYPIFLHDDGREMDLFNLISAPNLAVIKTGTRPRTTHEVPLLTVIASRQIDIDEPTATSESSGAPSTIKRSPLDFSNENPSEQINEGDGAEDQGLKTMAFVVPPTGPSSTMGAEPNIVEEGETAADAPLVSKRHRKRANEESNANAPHKVMRKGFDASHPTHSTIGGKSIASIRLGASSTVSAPASQKTPADTMNPDPISSFNSGWMSFSKRPGKKTSQCYTKPLDSLKNWNNRFFWVDERLFPTALVWWTSAPKDSMPLEGAYSVEDMAILNTRRTPIQKQPETLLCLVELSRRYFLGDDVYPIFLHDDVQGGDGLVQSDQRSESCRDQDRHPSSYCSRGATANEQINEGDGAEDQGPETMASVVPPVGPSSTMGVAPNIVEEEETAADAPLVSKRRHKKANEESNANAPQKVLRKDFDASHPTQSTVGGKSLASIRLGASSTVSAPASQETPSGTMNPDPISFVKPSSIPEQDIAKSSKGATTAGGPEPDPTSPTMVVSPRSIYQPEWGVTNGYHLDTPSSCQELVDHLAPPGYFLELRNLPNEDF